ncbi:MAG TPA: DUF3866 family protein [Gaiellaceae bacterium]|jgi:hypothetical protein|nr:DUF3866 family protein [Gaiellaceae bacterium]
MALSLRRGSVTAITERLEGLVRLEVDGRPSIAYPRLTGPVAVGDDVIVNVQAVELGLGSGGFDVVYANLTRGLGLAAEPEAHVMKLPYTPLQHAVRHAEEDGAQRELLSGLPVVCCSLHSQVAPACAGLGDGIRVAYVQLPGGALPVSLSDTVRVLRGRGLVERAVAVGACIDGDVACVSTAAALVWTAEQGFDAVVCGIGPGIVGTASPWGHGGLAAAEAVMTARTLGGRPVLAVRYSEADPRERHRGLSHHARAVLALAGEVEVGWPLRLATPEGLSDATLVDVTGWDEACAGFPLSHMGRGPVEDPWFFAVAFAAGKLARGLVS